MVPHIEAVIARKRLHASKDQPRNLAKSVTAERAGARGARVVRTPGTKVSYPPRAARTIAS